VKPGTPELARVVRFALAWPAARELGIGSFGDNPPGVLTLRVSSSWLYFQGEVEVVDSLRRRLVGIAQRASINGSTRRSLLAAADDLANVLRLERGELA